MEWKDFEPVLRDVWVGSIPKWRAKHLNVTELSEISVDFGTMTEGDIVFGAPAAAHIVMSSTEESFATYDDYGRPIWRSGSAEPRFQVGLTWNPGIRYEDGAVVTDGETIRLNSITYDKLLLATRQYNYLKEGELIQGDASTYQTAELHDLGLTLWGVTDGESPPSTASEIIDELPGIKVQTVAYWSDVGYVYNDDMLTKLAFDANGPVIWKYSNAATLRFGDLTTMQILGTYRSTGFRVQPYQNDADFFMLSISRYGDEFLADMIFNADGETDAQFVMHWSPTGMYMQHGESNPSLTVAKAGVTIRDYLAFHESSADPTTPPIGALVYDRAGDYYKFRNSAGVWRKLTDGAI